MQLHCFICQRASPFTAERLEFVAILDNMITKFCDYLVRNSMVKRNDPVHVCTACRSGYLKQVHEREAKILQLRSRIKTNVSNLSVLLRQNFTEVPKSKEAQAEPETGGFKILRPNSPSCQTASAPKILERKGIQYEKLSGVYQCKSCGFCARAKHKYAMFLHIDAVHASAPAENQPDPFADSTATSSKSLVAGGIPKKYRRLVEVAPDKFEYNGQTAERRKDGSFLCGSCRFTTRSIAILRKHLWEKQKPVIPRICEVCGKEFKTSQRFFAHRRTHPNGKEQKCNQCDKSCETKSRLKSHIQHVHRPSKPSKKYVCEFCGKEYKAKQGFDSHMNIYHSSIRKTYDCKLCGKSYTAYWSLRVHMNSHTGKKIHSCDVCGMKFTQPYSVVRHKRVAHQNS